MGFMPLCIETEVPDEELIVSHTDRRGIITYANETFAAISGYESSELIGRPHNIVRHPDMPASLFANLWETVNEGRLWSGYVKNLRKDGGYYWVYAQVSPLYDKEGTHIGFKSLRAPVEAAKRRELEAAYARLKETEEGVVKLSLWIDKELMRRLDKLASENQSSLSEALIRLCAGS